MQITTIIEDTVNKNRLMAEHGLAFWIEFNGRRFLFDTGQSGLIIENAAKLNIDLKTADALILSHGHYDHTGGLADVLKLSPNLKVYANHDAVKSKYSKNPDGSSRYNGMPPQCIKALSQHADICNVTGPTEICDGFYLTGPIPRLTDFEDTGGAFYKDEACTIPDEIIDDQAAFATTPDGVIVILGCAHAGVINTLRYIQQLTDSKPILTVVGGMHLVSADAERLDKTAAALREMHIETLIPCHCTGIQGVVKLWQEFPAKCSACPAGTVLKF